MNVLFKSSQIIYLCALFLFIGCNYNSKEKNQVKKTEIPTYLYGINTKSFKVIENKILKDKTLSEILFDAGLSHTLISEVTKKCDSVFDVRKIKTGNPFTLFYNKNDSLTQVKYFVYEINMIEYVVFDLHDSTKIQVFKKSKPVTLRESKIKGEIKTSLWNAMIEKGLSPNLAMQLADKFAWQIDFFAIQEGDFFKVVFIEEFIDSKSIGIKELKFAQFNQDGKNYYTIPFTQANGKVTYYDENGYGMKKAFLKAPLNFSRISSYFTEARFHPVLRIVRPHHGVDYAAPTGTPVMAIGDGMVVKKGYSGGGGNTVIIVHNRTYKSSYMHLSRYANIQVGSAVKQGQLIGYVGSTGLSSGPHLDFRIYKHGCAVNPLKVVSPPADPINKNRKAEFIHVRDSLIRILNGIK